MSFEKVSQNNPDKDKPEKLDDAWYERLRELASFQDYEYLTGDKERREKQKEQFLAGEIENPELDYPELDKINFSEKEKSLLALKQEILEQEKNNLVKQIYRWKINEKIAEWRMLRETQSKNDRRFSRYSRFIYGSPQKDIYEYTICQTKELIDQKLSDNDLKIREIAQKLNKELFDALLNNDNSISPRPLNISEKTTLAKKEIEYSAEGIKKAFEQALNKYRLTGWEIIVDNEGRFSAINVSQEQKKVNIPQTRKLKETRLLALIEHEIGTHVARRERGERTKLKLLGLGLDRYIKGEEGIATYKEQQVEGTGGFRGLDYHLAISLVMGVDGKKRNFRQVFEILKDFYFIRSKNKDKGKALDNANNFAWNDCMRVFRGTTCKTPGACLTKDIVYREGNIGVWNVVKNNPDEIRRFSIGKYDPSNPRHIWILDQLGITDKDLENLKESSKN